LAGSSVECISSSKVSTFDRRQLTWKYRNH
jgi:hypothetical protein